MIKKVIEKVALKVSYAKGTDDKGNDVIKSQSFRVSDILDELSSESVKAVVNFIKAKGIFTIDGSPITKVLKAEVIATEKTILDLA